jgi:hypothetical protein
MQKVSAAIHAVELSVGRRCETAMVPGAQLSGS